MWKVPRVRSVGRSTLAVMLVVCSMLLAAGCASSESSQRAPATKELQLQRCGILPDLLAQLECYNEHFEQVRVTEGIEPALEQLVNWHNDARSGPFSNHCHEVLHTLGEESMLSAGLDRSAQIQVFAHAKVTCTGGFVHGALTRFLDAFDRPRLDAELESLCPDTIAAVSEAIGTDADPTGWLSWNCDHMVGHAVYWTHTGELVAGAAWCTRFEKDAPARTGCEAGFFMEHFLLVGRNPGEGLTATPQSPDEVHELCRLVDRSVAFGCWTESGGILYIASDRSWAAAGDNCRRLAPDEELLKGCYVGLARNIAPYAGFEPAQMRAWCSEIGGVDARETCAIQVAGSMAMELAKPDEGLAICAAEMSTPARLEECEQFVNGTDAQLSGSGFGGGVGYST